MKHRKCSAVFDEQSHERNLQCRLDPQSIPPLLHRERNRERSFKLSRLLLSCLTHGLAGRTPPAGGREAAPLARCSPPALDILGPACCAGHHPSCPFTLSGSSVGQRRHQKIKSGHAPALRTEAQGWDTDCALCDSKALALGTGVLVLQPCVPQHSSVHQGAEHRLR